MRDDTTSGSESSNEQDDALPSKNSAHAQPSKPEIQSALSNSQSPSPKDLPKDLPRGSTVPHKAAAPPPLPLENPPPRDDDDGWDPVWDSTAQAYYFYNRFTHVTQWDNPRVPSAKSAVAPGLGTYDRIPSTVTKDSTGDQQAPPPRPHGGYDPAIHGDYDPNAPYAQEAAAQVGADDSSLTAAGLGALVAGDGDPATIYAATGAFNRFTGKWQPSTINPENHNDENKSKRQMSAFFDVDAAANSHNGKSLKAERSGKKLTKQELKAFKEKRKEKKEERRRAWLRD